MGSITFFRCIAVASIAVFIVMSGCVSGEKPSQAAADMANVTVDRILLSLNSSNYNDFTMNYSVPMMNSTSESSFNALRSKVSSQFGNYVSRAPVPQASVSQGYNVFVYDCQFEKGRHPVKLVMDPANVSLVQGLWFTDLS